MEQITNTSLTEQLLNDFKQGCELDDKEEIKQETKNLEEFKMLYKKHMFDDMGPKFRDLISTLFNYLDTIKKQYKDKYGTT